MLKAILVVVASAAWAGVAEAAVVTEAHARDLIRFEFTVPAPFESIDLRFDYRITNLTAPDATPYFSSVFVDGVSRSGSGGSLGIGTGSYREQSGGEPPQDGTAGYILFVVDSADIAITNATLALSPTLDDGPFTPVAFDRITVTPPEIVTPLPGAVALIGPALGLLAYLRHRQTIRRA